MEDVGAQFIEKLKIRMVCRDKGDRSARVYKSFELYSSVRDLDNCDRNGMGFKVNCVPLHCAEDRDRGVVRV
jgi:hypothetical protein